MIGSMMSEKRALIVGVTGIVGGNLAAELVAAGGWAIDGISLRAPAALPGVAPIVADLRDREATRSALGAVRPTHVFYCTWARMPTETENCRVNGAMIENLFDAIPAAADVQHAALVTGLKHYLGPFEAYAKSKPETPFTEDQPRLPGENFYYTQEDVLFDRAVKRGFSWSVHRPHTLIGYALGNAMNMGVTLAVYASICRETGRPFLFPGSPQQYEAVTDVTDARLLAHQMIWAAETPAAANEAFNVVNGDVFRWTRLWRVIAGYFGLEPAPYPGHPVPLESQMADAAPIWTDMIARYGLQPNSLERLASWWHSDADLGREVECFSSMAKSRRLGFTEFCDTESSFLALFDRLRRERIIP